MNTRFLICVHIWLGSCIAFGLVVFGGFPGSGGKYILSVFKEGFKTDQSENYFGEPGGVIPRPVKTVHNLKKSKDSEEPEVVFVPLGNSPFRGRPNAPVTIIVFTDYQCPFCGKLDKTLREIETEYPGQVRIVQKMYPLPFHSDAHLASQAALAAHKQGKFWIYQDILFEHQKNLSRAELIDYADEVGLDVPMFISDLDSGFFFDLVEHEIELGKKFEVVGTPTYFINGKKNSGARPKTFFEEEIDKELR